MNQDEPRQLKLGNREGEMVKEKKEKKEKEPKGNKWVLILILLVTMIISLFFYFTGGGKIIQNQQVSPASPWGGEKVYQF